MHSSIHLELRLLSVCVHLWYGSCTFAVWEHFLLQQITSHISWRLLRALLLPVSLPARLPSDVLTHFSCRFTDFHFSVRLCTLTGCGWARLSGSLSDESFPANFSFCFCVEDQINSWRICLSAKSTGIGNSLFAFNEVLLLFWQMDFFSFSKHDTYKITRFWALYFRYKLIPIYF